jgi:hypothetical protein
LPIHRTLLVQRVVAIYKGVEGMPPRSTRLARIPLPPCSWSRLSSVPNTFSVRDTIARKRFGSQRTGGITFLRNCDTAGIVASKTVSDQSDLAWVDVRPAGEKIVGGSAGDLVFVS